MSFSKLLVTGKSWGVGPGGRYRVNKLVQLPKFNSPKNPFATAVGSGTGVSPVRTELAGRTGSNGRAARATTHAPERDRSPVAAGGEQEARRIISTVADESEHCGRGTARAPGNNFSAQKLAGTAARAPRVVGAQAVRAAKWLGEWGQKLNPLPLLARKRGPARSANNFKAPIVQTEMSLDAVKVVRNDLSDADLEVVLVSKPIAPNQAEQLIMASAGGREPAGGSLNRLSSWMFGAKSS